MEKEPSNTKYDDLEEISSFLASLDDLNVRLDKFITNNLPSHSRSRIKNLIKGGMVMLNQEVVIGPNYRMKEGDQVRISIPKAQDPTPKGENIKLDIVYEDDDLIVINKQSGLVVHPAAGNWSGTLVNALIAHCGESLSGVGGVRRPGIVHRLDKDTTGVMVIAKNDLSHRHLSAQFADHGREGNLIRSYLALCWASPAKFSGVIDLPIGRDKHNRLKQAIDKKNGKFAITEYKVLEKYLPKGDNKARNIRRGSKKDHRAKPIASLIDCTLKTGRTHQLRVHLSQIGCPIIGDQQYGKGFESSINKLLDEQQSSVMKLKRQALHAYKLQFKHPSTDEIMLFCTELPKDIQNIVNGLKENND